MIGNLLAYVAEDLNRYICRQQGLQEDERKVLLSYVVDQDGSIATNEQNVVLVTLVDLALDPLAYSQRMQPIPGGGVTEEIQYNSLHVNVMVLFSAYFKGDRAKDALNYLTLILQFFQSKSSFTRANSPGLPDGIERLEFSMEPLDFHAQNHMWGILGAKYMPSVVYKLRMISFFDEQDPEYEGPIRTISIDTQT
ncbi:DUF4255 domain-containing protein [Rubritalea marina]|uniref:DUF4255 domain-containing protein n=1 Tax=Rubritalea marina TaxID=361055 RepID=UPI00037CE6AF|nr:DUF4255 domain-containing protein [Rubritalea marina]